jgi:hypothetical protein
LGGRGSTVGGEGRVSLAHSQTKWIRQALTSLIDWSQLAVQNTSFWVFDQSIEKTSRVCSCHLRIGKSCAAPHAVADRHRLAFPAHGSRDAGLTIWGLTAYIECHVP